MWVAFVFETSKTVHGISELRLAWNLPFTTTSMTSAQPGSVGTFGTLRHISFVCFKMLNLDSSGPRGKDNEGNAVCSDAVVVAASSGLAKQESRY